MTEIDIPSGSAPISPSRGPSMRLVVIAIVVILIIGGAFVGFTLLGGMQATTTTTETTSTTTSTTSTTVSNHDSTILYSYSQFDPGVYPDIYYNDFYLSTDQVDDTTPPDVLFTAIYYDTGNDLIDDITFWGECYDISGSSFASMSWTDRWNHLVERITIHDTGSNYIDLPKQTGTYTWVFYYDIGEKTDAWTVSVYVTLRYNWVL